MIAANLWRGRDHGIPGYNFYLEACGSKRATDFNDLLAIMRPAVSFYTFFKRMENNKFDYRLLKKLNISTKVSMMSIYLLVCLVSGPLRAELSAR